MVSRPKTATATTPAAAPLIRTAVLLYQDGMISGRRSDQRIKTADNEVRVVRTKSISSSIPAPSTCRDSEYTLGHMHEYVDLDSGRGPEFAYELRDRYSEEEAPREPRLKRLVVAALRQSAQILRGSDGHSRGGVFYRSDAEVAELRDRREPYIDL